MKILVVGDKNSQAEFKLKFGAKHSVMFKSSETLKAEDVTQSEIIFDFNINQSSAHSKLYHLNQSAIILVNSVKTTISALVKNYKWTQTVIGFNGLPGFFNRPLLEITLSGKNPELDQVFHQLGTGYRVVKDRVGMVTPRVICMIINEAFYTVQEGTANAEDINIAMKLGTNYPAGPFEMLQSIGVRQVYQLLQAIHSDTGEERYKICPLLKSVYLEEE
ncbi:MAG: hypothetical protein DHS20C17_26840 [Cyclobacteriaceae bacterium]|nr:MAG: hypothetical protein DHS20C17_26840 [Cyclobacteriaceae bacterium]